MPAKLSFAGLRFERSVAGSEPKVSSADVHWGAQRGAFASSSSANGTAAITVGAIKPVVQTVIEPVQSMLLIAFVEPGIENFSHVCLAIPVSILCVKDVWRGAHDDSPAPRNYSGRKIQAVEEHRGFVIDTVMIRFFEKTHDSPRFTPAVCPQRIIPHFHNPKFSI